MIVQDTFSIIGEAFFSAFHFFFGWRVFKKLFYNFGQCGLHWLNGIAFFYNSANQMQASISSR